ncbi:MAG TPA: M28 family peptidase [Trueperaceae bacterium]
MVSRPREDELLSQVSGRRLMDATAAIAQWVRLSGEPDELKSFRWIEARLREYGYETELLHHRAYISLPEAAMLSVEGGGEFEGISHAFATSTPATGVTARLVDANDPDADFTGAIVLIDGMASGVSVTNWEARGTVGQVHVHDDHLHETSVSPVWGNPTERGLELMPGTPSMSIRRSTAGVLRERLAQGPVTVTIHTRTLTEWRPIPLLIADLAAAPDRPFVLLSTHVDSWYYGAMDNGSANATVIEVARILAQRAKGHRRGLRLAFWSGHSHGRFAGSAWYADEKWHELYDHCIANVFVDSTGGMGATIVTEAPVMPQTKALASRAVNAVTGEEFEGKRIGRFADQSFYGIGLNSVFGTLSEQDAADSGSTISFKTGGKRAGGLGWWWHTPADTVDKVDEEFLVRDTKIYLAVVNELLTADLLPFDYRPAVDEIVETVRPRVQAAREQLDLSRLMLELESLQRDVHEFHEAATKAPAQSNELINDTLLGLSRHLVPIAFHEEVRYVRDPAAPLVPVPSMKDLERLAKLPADDPTAHAIATRLHRTANWVVSAARAAARLARSATEALRGG